MDNHDIKVMADGAAVVVGVSGFMSWFPPVVALVGGLLTIIWLSLRIYETETVKSLIKYLRGK
jgi:Flp pilus assembly protein protease CpaA